MMSTSVEVMAGVSVDSTFDELDTERLQLVHQVVDGSGMITQCQQDQRSLCEQTTVDRRCHVDFVPRTGCCAYRAIQTDCQPRADHDDQQQVT